jgi:gas vesicle protein
MANNGKVALALLIGAAAGAALGLLFAPEKGEDTRKKIVDGANDLGKKVMRKGDHITDSSEDMYNEVRSNVTRNV